MNPLKRLLSSRKKPSGVYVLMDKAANDWFIMNPGNPVAGVERCLYCGCYHLSGDPHVCLEGQKCKKS